MDVQLRIAICGVHMAESLLTVGPNFVSSICKQKPIKKKPENLFFMVKKPEIFSAEISGRDGVQRQQMDGIELTASALCQ